MGLSGQLLIARKDPRGYVAWIAGNLALMVVYYRTEQTALIGLQLANTAIQIGALINWRRTVIVIQAPISGLINRPDTLTEP